MTEREILAKKLLCRLEYVREEGKFVWKISYTGYRLNGSEAGTLNAQGRIVIYGYGRIFQRSHLVFLAENGRLPDLVDHIDRNKTNDRISNLRECTKSQNAMNSKVRADNALRERCIRQYSPTSSYFIKVVKDGVEHKRRAKTLEEARQIRDDLLNSLHGEFAGETRSSTSVVM